MVEEDHEEDRHHVHHGLHARHLLLAGVGHVHVVFRVDDVRDGHQQAEEAHVVAEVGRDERDVGVPADDRVVGRQVVRPKEALVAQLDGRREEHEQGDQDRHLEQHGQASAHRAGPGAAIKLHDRFLALEGLFLSRVFRVDLFHLGAEDPHLGRREVRLARQGEEDDLHDQGKDEDQDAIVADELTQEVEERDHEILVDPPEEPPAQRHQLLEVQLLVATQLVVVILQEGELVGAEIVGEVGRRLATQVEGDLGGRAERLQQLARREPFRLKVRLVETFFRD